jgi:hypothetical protein
MKILLKDLPPDAVYQITGLVREQGLGTGVFVHPVRRNWLLYMGVISLGLGLLSAWILVRGELASAPRMEALLPWVGLIGLVYGPLALVEYLRVLGAQLKPFLLLTPVHLVRCHGSHRALEVHRLSEAAAFQRVEEYDGAKWKGQAYAFDFDGGAKVHFTLNKRQDVEAANRVLDLARAAAGGERLPGGILNLGDFRPNPALAQREGNLQQFLDPASELWLVMLGLLCIGFVIWALLRSFLR